MVAGINYKLVLEIADKSGIPHLYQATVFVPLPHTGQKAQVVDLRAIPHT